MKHLRTMLLTVAVMALLATGASAASVTSFSDVPETHWAHSAIMTMVQGGLFNGKTEPVNGVGTFAPDAPMTRAEFVTVLTRLLYAQRITGTVTGEKWWQENYDVALAAGLLAPGELENGALDAPMQRQEAAMVLVRASAAKGFPQRLAKEEAIADYEMVGDAYKEYVRTCFALGLLQGVDAQGSFQPSGTLTRAQAATVIYRLVDSASRSPLADSDTEFVNTAGAARGEDLPTIAGVLAQTETERPELKTKKLATARKNLNKYLKKVYDYQFYEDGIALSGDGPAAYAKFIQHEDKRLGLEITNWRADYNSTPEVNQQLNLILEAMVYLSGDAEVGYALWNWKDAANVNGFANSDHFGFTDITAHEESGGIVTMHGIVVEVDNSTTNVTRYYFSEE
ncbi:MAG: S-layer homology domain-containing protein [Oscillibacter sp.]|nr:S-layer homology domain-containing protein [Oscillibacter sp.]